MHENEKARQALQEGNMEEAAKALHKAIEEDPTIRLTLLILATS